MGLSLKSNTKGGHLTSAFSLQRENLKINYTTTRFCVILLNINKLRTIYLHDNYTLTTR